MANIFTFHIVFQSQNSADGDTKPNDFAMGEPSPKKLKTEEQQDGGYQCNICYGIHKTETNHKTYTVQETPHCTKVIHPGLKSCRSKYSFSILIEWICTLRVNVL